MCTVKQEPVSRMFYRFDLLLPSTAATSSSISTAFHTHTHNKQYL